MELLFATKNVHKNNSLSSPFSFPSVALAGLLHPRAEPGGWNLHPGGLQLPGGQLPAQGQDDCAGRAGDGLGPLLHHLPSSRGLALQLLGIREAGQGHGEQFVT